MHLTSVAINLLINQITNGSFTYASPQLWNQLPSSFINLILFTLLLFHLILCISPHYRHHLCSHHLSLLRLFTPDLKLIFHKSFPP